MPLTHKKIYNIIDRANRKKTAQINLYYFNLKESHWWSHTHTHKKRRKGKQQRTKQHQKHWKIESVYLYLVTVILMLAMLHSGAFCCSHYVGEKQYAGFTSNRQSIVEWTSMTCQIGFYSFNLLFAPIGKSRKSIYLSILIFLCHISPGKWIVYRLYRVCVCFLFF